MALRISALFKILKSVLKQFNFYDLILNEALKKPSGEFIKGISNITKAGSPINFIRQFLKNPNILANQLKGLNLSELSQLSNLLQNIIQEKQNTEIQDNKTEARALSSSWLVFAVYTPLTETNGTIKITTIEGSSYDFPTPIRKKTWDDMKAAKGRNGTGAGKVFWDQYWHAIKRGTAKQGQAVIFKILGINKKKK